VLAKTSLEYHKDESEPGGGDSKELFPNSNHAVAGRAPTLATEGPRYGICWYAETPEAVMAATVSAANFELVEAKAAVDDDDEDFFTLAFLEIIFFFFFLFP